MAHVARPLVHASQATELMTNVVEILKTTLAAIQAPELLAQTQGILSTCATLEKYVLTAEFDMVECLARIQADAHR